jgi:catechol 2,3-dioxygenase-like lactoylglutathione lyase family enzyme
MAKLLRPMTVLEVADVERAAAFWRDRLGFTPGPFYGDPPAFCIVGRDGVDIALDRSAEQGRQPLNQYWAVYIYVDDVEAIAAEMRDRGVEIIRGPETAEYGCREIDVRDPDGHIVCFGQDLDPPAGA